MGWRIERWRGRRCWLCCVGTRLREVGMYSAGWMAWGYSGFY